MPEWLLWLLPVPVATVGAVAWSAWSGRARGPGQTEDSVQAYERFRAAMERPAVGGPGEAEGTGDPPGRS